MKYLRDVEEADIDLLYQWANDDKVRKNAFSSQKIIYENHVNWFINHYNSDKCDIYILMDNDVSIGQVRLDYKNEEAYIDYSIQEKFRNMGYGTIILDLLEKKLIQLKKYVVLVAQVKKENVTSYNRFVKLDYKCYEYQNYFEFRKKIKEKEEK